MSAIIRMTPARPGKESKRTMTPGRESPVPLPGEPERLRAALHHFLSSPEGGEYLDAVARMASKTARTAGLPPAAIGLSPEGGGAEAAMTAGIRSALAEFLLEKRSVQRAVLCPDAPNPERYLETAFIRHWVDGVRQRTADPFRDLRDYAMRVLREDDRFHRRILGKAVQYSLCRDNRTIQPLSEDDLFDIPFPEEIAGERSLSGVKRIAVMPALATHFWQAIGRLYGADAVWVDLNALVRWILSHVTTPDVQPVFSHLDAVDEWASDPRTRPDVQYFDPERVGEFAEIFSNRLKDRLKPSFYLHYCRELPFREMARVLGYADATGRNHVAEIHGALQTYLRELPWHSPPDLNEAAFHLFFEILCRILENTVPSA